LTGRGDVQVQGLGKVARYADAVLVEGSEVILPGSMAVVSSGLVTLRGLGSIARDTVAVLEKIAKKELGFGTAARDLRAQPIESDGKIRIAGVVLKEQLR
jgi:hypothetical protein